MARKKKEIPGLTEEFINSVNSMDSAARKLKIVTLQFLVNETEDYLKNNEKIQQARETLAELTGPGKDTLKVLKNQTKYLIDILNGKDTQDQGTA